MNKPNGYDNAREFTEYKPLPAGAYVCKIIGVEEAKSSAGKDMIKIALDVAEGPHADHYKKDFAADSRAEKKWPCVVYQVVYDSNGETASGFKTFITSVERSNGNQPTVWGDRFAAALKGKRVGGLFRREEYINSKGEHKWITKCFMFRSTDKLAECEVPKDKYLDGQTGGSTGGTNGGYAADAGAQEPKYNDDNVPF